MKVGELRKVVEKYNKKELTYIVTEMYKAFPKKMLLEKDIDFIVENPNPSKSTKAKKNAVKIPNMDDLYDEVSEFCSNAKQQLYYAPNRTIPKKERSGWRFKVLKMYKNLIIAGSLEENNVDVGLSIAELYKILCIGCGFYIFASTDTFSTIKIPQQIFFNETLNFNKKFMPNEDFIMFNIKLLIENAIDQETSSGDLIDIALTFFDTDKDFKAGVKACENLIQETKKLKGKMSDYDIKSRVDDIAEFAFHLYMKLNEGENAISFLKKYFDIYNQEVFLYITIRLLKNYDADELIIREYESAVKNGVNPRVGLNEIYKQCLEYFEEM